MSKKKVEWSHPDSDGYITKEKMDKNLSFCSSIVCKLSSDSLSHYADKISGASKGNISEPQMQMADFGEIRYSAYIFNEKTNRYKEVLIKIYGDWVTNNESTEAAEIYGWFNRIGVK